MAPKTPAKAKKPAKKAAPKAAPKAAKAPAKAKAPKAKAAAAGGTPAALTLKQLAAQVAEANDLPKKQVDGLFNALVDLIGKNLKKGVKIRIAGLGILQVRKRAARMGRNPATGEAIKIKASKKIAFRAAKELKEAI
jgi:DNA-binding protein HU-beta